MAALVQRVENFIDIAGIYDGFLRSIIAWGHNELHNVKELTTESHEPLC